MQTSPPRPQTQTAACQLLYTPTASKICTTHTALLFDQSQPSSAHGAEVTGVLTLTLIPGTTQSPCSFPSLNSPLFLLFDGPFVRLMGVSRHILS